MRGSGAAAILVVLLTQAEPVRGAQGLVPARGVSVFAFGGAMSFGRFHEQTLPTPPPEPGIPTEPPLQRVASAARAPTAGVAAVFWLTPNWGGRAHFAATRTRLIDRLEPVATEPPRPNDVAPVQFAPMTVRVYDASAVFRLPARIGELSPYGLAGAGFADYRPEPGAELPPGVVMGERERRFAGVLGIGASYAFGRWAVAAEVTNHLSRSPVAGREPAVPPAQLPMNRDRDGVVNQFRFVVGGSYTVPIRRRPPVVALP